MDRPAIFDETLVLTFGETIVGACRDAGVRPVYDASSPMSVIDHKGELTPQISYYDKFTILIPEGHEELRDAVAIKVGDERCRWAYLPEDIRDTTALRNAFESARPMWTDEVATIDDIPDPGEVKTYETGFQKLDQHGLRLALPAFMPVIGPYGSGKSVFLRQLLVNLWKLHGWKFLLTSFEEKVKPRYQRDLRRHVICAGAKYDLETGEEHWWRAADKGRNESTRVEWSPTAEARADAEIRQMAVFLRRKRNTTLDMDRLLDRIEFAVRVYGLKVVVIDPVNEIDHQVGKGESKTDYMGRFIMRLKQLADDYGLLVICCAHPPKDGVEKRMSKKGVLTLNDGADTAHWGNKADIGLCLWRDLDGPTLLHIDKVKDHESMGKPTLAEMELDLALNKFTVTRVGYDILKDAAQ
jgi:KaiC/GvpD/RAD55 family RecA-like ATPase